MNNISQLKLPCFTAPNSELTTWPFNRKDGTRRQLTGR